MLSADRRDMCGLAECPDCGQELSAPLKAGGKFARCNRCRCRFMLPSADMLFNNAAVYLMANEVADNESDLEAKRQMRFLV